MHTPANQTKETSGDYSNYAPASYPPQYGTPTSRPPVSASQPNHPYPSEPYRSRPAYPGYDYTTYSKPQGAPRGYPPPAEYNSYSRYNNRGYPPSAPPYDQYPPRSESYTDARRSRFGEAPRSTRFDVPSDPKISAYPASPYVESIDPNQAIPEIPAIVAHPHIADPIHIIDLPLDIDLPPDVDLLHVALLVLTMNHPSVNVLLLHHAIVTHPHVIIHTTIHALYLDPLLHHRASLFTLFHSFTVWFPLESSSRSVVVILISTETSHHFISAKILLVSLPVGRTMIRVKFLSSVL